MPDPEVKEAEQEKKGGNPLLLIIVAVVVLALAAGGFAFFVLTSKGQETKQQEAKKEEKKPGIFYEFENAFIVNLSEPNAERYLKVHPVLEVDSEDVVEEIKQKLPQVKDILITIFSSKGLDDVTSLAGKDRLKQEIMDKINEVLSKGKVEGVYFEEFVIQ